MAGFVAIDVLDSKTIRMPGNSPAQRNVGPIQVSDKMKV